MKVLIICLSICHQNTAKIAKAMAEVLQADLKKPSEVDVDGLADYDLIGFGSGIFFTKHHKTLLGLADKLPEMKSKKAFIFSTSGLNYRRFNRALRNKLKNKGFNIIGEFGSYGLDTWGPFKPIGGIRKGRPNEKDVERAREFARGLG